MADAFDPFLIWLSIPRDKRPVNYYQLLGLKEFTDNADVIENSAQRQRSHVRMFVDGEHGDQAKGIIEQLEKAHACLMDDERRAKYDKRLRAKLGGQDSPPDKPKAADKSSNVKPAKSNSASNTAGVATANEPRSADPRESVGVGRPANSRKIVVLCAAVVILIAGGGVAVYMILNADPKVGVNDGPSGLVPPATKLADVPEADAPTNDNPPPDDFIEGERPATELASPNDPEAPETDGAVEPPVDPVSAAGAPIHVDSPIEPNPNDVQPADPMPGDPIPADPNQKPQDPLDDNVSPADLDPPTTPGSGDDVAEPPAEEDARRPIPPDDALKKALAIVREVYAEEYEQAETAKKRIELATSMMAAATGTNNDAAGRFVLYRLARDVAASAGDLDSALHAVEQLDRDYRIDTWQMRHGVVEKLLNGTRDRDAIKSATGKIIGLADRALREENYDQAEAFAETALAAARRARDGDAVKQVRDLEKNIAQRAKTFRAMEETLALLTDDPDNPAANLTAGKYYCFSQGQWDKGIEYLAKGGDADLQTVAKLELAKPADAAAFLEVADAWWDLSNSAKEVETPPMLHRAAKWYRQALPLAVALRKVKAEKRLEEIAKLTADAPSVPDDMGRRTTRPLKPVEVVFLDDLQEAQSRIGWGKLGKRGASGFPTMSGRSPQQVIFRGEPQRHALSAHPPAEGSSLIDYNLGGKFHVLAGYAGFIDKNESISRYTDVTFKVLGDGKLLWRSWPIRLDGQRILVNITGVRHLRLEINCPRGSASTWAAWIAPQVMRFRSAPTSAEQLGDVHTVLGYRLKPHPAGAKQFNGHWYAMVAEPMTWNAAQRWCEQRGGYLACLESAQESTFLNSFRGNDWLWLGGVKYADGTWSWINGSRMQITLWGPNEPNDQFGVENKLSMFHNGRWNDISHRSKFVKGFVCEWEF